MSSPRESLIAKFRAGSLDRIRRVTLALIELNESRGDDTLLQTTSL